MNGFVKLSMDAYVSDLHLKIEVYNVVRDMVDDVETWDAENRLRKTQNNLSSTQKLNDVIISSMKRLQEKNAAMGLELSKLKLKASGTRESFVRDIGSFLSENKQMKKLKDKINDLEAKLQHMSLYGYDNESDAAQEVTSSELSPESESIAETGTTQAAEINSGASQAVETLKKEQQMFLYDLDDEFLMNVFSYLETVEVLHCAQMNKYMVKKVYILFEIESTMVQPEWSIRPDQKALQLEAAQQQPQTQMTQGSTNASGQASVNKPSGSAPASNNNTAASSSVASPSSAVATPSFAVAPEPIQMSKEVVDALTKKLTPDEMKAVLAPSERLRKQNTQLNALLAEREDIIALKENAESVRDFMIEKLKAAEMEIKKLMGETQSLKKQAASDQDIIGYLDLQVGELEAQRTELGTRCQQLQASLDLQIGSHSHREHTLTTELNDYKLKYEKLDVNFKTQKKVLIKEVKQLRSQVDTLTTERNLQTNQFRLLREALALGGGNATK
uniref:F-box domain-containing protein n=1 Tax=Spumella elongata TaxID=89044 RepID=A0A7S3LZC2_9STRA|mmetsp:Transcript_13516/g.23693  ORF Transcript_13516/g.23693 Transcript_13516/m.23693 type:complete len:503 (+) Transcript_13516:53-1561(+)